MYAIGPFRLDPDAAILTHEGVRVPVGGRAVAVLAALVRRPNEQVSRKAILDAAWAGRVVEDSNLAVQIFSLRRALARAPGGERWIETVARRGYRFVGPVSHVPGAASARRTNLQPALTSFVGRERERDDVERLLPAARLLTLTGMGGIGKTRLAQQVASDVMARYRDGAWFVNLAPLAHGELVASAVGQAVGARATPGSSAMEALQAHLREREMLLVLDNCEHVIESCAHLVVALLRANASLAIIATSREPLHVSGEQVFPLPPLSLPSPTADADAAAASDAIRLFVERARRHDPRFDLTPALAPAVTRLCIHLDGIPLALELAAARVSSLSIEQIDARLGDRFRLLRSRGRMSVARHQTLRATMDWSHDLLAEDKRVVLRRLAVFSGGFTLDAAVHVAGFGAIHRDDVIELVSQLVDRSLVIADTIGAHARYRLLETTRAYALEKLEQARETDIVHRRHAEFFAAYFERAADAWMLTPDDEWCDANFCELDNVRAAIEWARGSDGVLGARLAGGAGPMWVNLALWSESLPILLDAVQRMPADTPDAVRARLLLWLAIRYQGAPEHALPAFEEAIALYRRCGDALALGDAMGRLARVLTTRGSHARAAALLSEAYPLIKSAGSAKALALYFAAAGFLKVETGDLAGARRDYLDAVTQYRLAGSIVPALVVLGNLANIAWAQGDLEGAAAAYAESIAALNASETTRRTGLAWAYCNYSGVLTEMGRLDEALQAARQGLPLFRSSEHLWLLAEHFALREALRGNLAAATRLAGYSDATLAAKGATRQTNEARARARLERLFGVELSVQTLQGLLAEGTKMADDEAMKLAMGE